MTCVTTLELTRDAVIRARVSQCHVAQIVGSSGCMERSRNYSWGESTGLWSESLVSASLRACCSSRESWGPWTPTARDDQQAMQASGEFDQVRHSFYCSVRCRVDRGCVSETDDGGFKSESGEPVMRLCGPCPEPALQVALYGNLGGCRILSITTVQP